MGLAKPFVQVVLPNDPATALQAGTKQYTDTGLSGKADTGHTHTEADVTSLTTDLAGKANASHTHAETDITSLESDLAGKADTGHTHTETDIASLTTDLAGKANTGHTHVETDVTSLTTDLAGKASTSHTHDESDITTGTIPAARLPVVRDVPVALTDTGTIAVDASLGNFFRLTLTAGGHVMGTPSNPTDGQRILFEIVSGGALSFTWAGTYVWGSDITVPALSQTAGTVDYVGFIYNAAAGKWRGLAYARGY